MREGVASAFPSSVEEVEEGWPRHQENIATASFEGSERGGVGRDIVFLTNTTPSARKEVASPIFLDARIHPSSAPKELELR